MDLIVAKKTSLKLLVGIVAFVGLLTQFGELQSQEILANQSRNLDEANKPVHRAENATTQFELHPGLEAGLFAAEPMLANPTNIDIDHLGRVWVCEVVNYRHFRNKDANPREDGDRILILEDTDGDAVADKSTVFYQGRDIDSAHGICVLGNRAVISANDSVFFLIDTDGDLKADKKELLFTGISGVQHDHGIHACVFGPDGKLYFNFGNEGKQICDANGKLIVDSAGNRVKDERKPYTQGMIFRCNLDGSEFETLAWNFRNNWELCVDSFGSIWQSDNDDDGHRATRINYVMPFGDYGYTEQGTGNNWMTSRTGMHDEVPIRHWHQNDPGVVPNLLQTGAGSPTGICVYEGQLLPEVFHNQIIHCDAGPSIVRAYPVKKSGAGYTADTINLMDASEKNQWFRPSDVCVAPDGSLIVADWYDPGVGGHRMQDTERGRLFRLTAKGTVAKYGASTPDFSTPDAAAAALKSPNQATRYLAWKALERFGPAAQGAVDALWQDRDPRIRARGLWMLAHLGLPKTDVINYLGQALVDANPDIRVVAIRVCVHLRDTVATEDIQEYVRPFDTSPEVRRELLIGLRQWPIPGEHMAQIWAVLANQYRPGDRWYLEALGIAADGHWDDCLAAWLGDTQKQRDEQLSSAAGQDIVWRSRGNQTPGLMAKIIRHQTTTAASATRYFRALDLFDSPTEAQILTDLAFGKHEFGKDKMQSVVMESASRLDTAKLSMEQKSRLEKLIENSRGDDFFVKLVDKFSSEIHYDDLLKLATEPTNRQLAADAMGVLMDKQQQGRVHKAIVDADESTREVICDALVNCGKRPAAFVLAGVAKREDLDTPLRSYVIKRLGEIHSGANDMIWWIDENESLDPLIMPALQAALHRAPWESVKQRAQELFPMAPTKDNRPLPPMGELANRTGNVAHGKQIFETTGTCAKCHVVNQQGIEVGPDLSEIGNKLTREAMYESILFPSAGISHNYENWLVMTVDGEMITGVLMGATDAEIQLKDDKGIRHTISMDDVEQKRKQKLSLMPADLHKELSEQDLVDVVEYMTTLKK